MLHARGQRMTGLPASEAPTAPTASTASTAPTASTASEPPTGSVASTASVASTTSAAASRHAWVAILDDLEADVEETAAAIAADRPVPARSWQPPDEPGPVPDELRERAAGLFERLAAVRARAQAQHLALVDEQMAVDRRRDAGCAYAANTVPPRR